MGNRTGSESPSGTSTPPIPAGGLAGRGAQLHLLRTEKHSDPKQRANYLFYTNQIASKPDGALVDEILEHWKFQYRLLEEHHGYIQWLFPVFESAGMSWDSDALTREEAVLLKQDFEACCRFLRAYKMMLNFYGVILKDLKTGELERNPKNWQKRYNNIYKHPHNNLRISRILISLGEFGFVHYKAHFFAHWKREILEFGYLRSSKKSLQDFWEPLMNHDSPEYAKKTLEEPSDRDPCILVKHMEDDTDEWKAVFDELNEYMCPSVYPADDDISDFTFSDNISSEDPNLIPYHDHGPDYAPVRSNIDDILNHPEKYIPVLQKSRGESSNSFYEPVILEQTHNPDSGESSEVSKPQTPPPTPDSTHHRLHLLHLPHPHLPHFHGRASHGKGQSKDDSHLDSPKLNLSSDSRHSVTRTKSARVKGSSDDDSKGTPKQRKHLQESSQPSSQAGTPERSRRHRVTSSGDTKKKKEIQRASGDLTEKLTVHKIRSSGSRSPKLDRSANDVINESSGNINREEKQTEEEQKEHVSQHRTPSRLRKSNEVRNSKEVKQMTQ